MKYRRQFCSPVFDYIIHFQTISVATAFSVVMSQSPTLNPYVCLEYITLFFSVLWSIILRYCKHITFIYFVFVRFYTVFVCSLAILLLYSFIWENKAELFRNKITSNCTTRKREHYMDRNYNYWAIYISVLNFCNFFGLGFVDFLLREWTQLAICYKYGESSLLIINEQNPNSSWMPDICSQYLYIQIV